MRKCACCGNEAEDFKLCKQCGASPYYKKKGWTRQDVKSFLDNLPVYEPIYNKDGNCPKCLSFDIVAVNYKDKTGWHYCNNCKRYWDEFWTDTWLFNLALEQWKKYKQTLKTYKRAVENRKLAKKGIVRENTEIEFR